MRESLLSYPCLMVDPDTRDGLPVIVDAFDYDMAVSLAVEATGPGELWHGMSPIVLDVPVADPS